MACLVRQNLDEATYSKPDEVIVKLLIWKILLILVQFLFDGLD